MLEISLTHTQGAFRLAADLRLGAGLTALFGPSGSGKTTLINAVAGLIRPEAGRVVFNGTVWSDSKSGTFLPVHRRRIGYVFQEPRLFPHLSVRANLLYGQRFAPHGDRRDSLDAVADLLGIAPLLDRAPNRLSGGEKQRVAIGRALLSCPRLLVMDEPLSALDQTIKAQILPYIERIRDEAGVPILYVSHSAEEVTRLATHIVAMRAGEASLLDGTGDLPGPLPDLGDNRSGSFIRAVITGHAPKEGLTFAASDAGTLYLKRTDLPVGQAIRLFLPVSDVVLAGPHVGDVSTLNRLNGRVRSINDLGESLMVEVDCSGEIIRAEITRRSEQALQLAPDAPVTVLFKAVSIRRGGLYRGAE
ncbi:molybdenum ABC transporter ATP-binding protein [Allorhizobium sp. BGMRC 0089]|uniref:molybdenum ABC transporter ATP-binding protein n=1 Tax=Allorhizobium sonneratiae TaxID=2934936 RepID=UPI0020344A21|nr:molybdenum ABC transporter ATP-binding protein [Allorhizobium sonneratiae]MCM2294549.1 molybdenum ABC transporter ATP-binding protein [Allorhizobium sonneratiae]